MTFIFREYLRRANLTFAVEEQTSLGPRDTSPHERQEDTEVPVVYRATGFRYLL
jgi:hypothetical protein